MQGDPGLVLVSTQKKSRMDMGMSSIDGNKSAMIFRLG